LSAATMMTKRISDWRQTNADEHIMETDQNFVYFLKKN
jgi:hypothetical protein